MDYSGIKVARVVRSRLWDVTEYIDDVLYLLTKNDVRSFIVIDVGMKVDGGRKGTKSRDESTLVFICSHMQGVCSYLPPGSSLHIGIWTDHGLSRRNSHAYLPCP